MRKILISSFFMLALYCFGASIASAYYFKDNFDSYTVLTGTQWTFVTTAATLDTTGGYGSSKAIKFTYSGSVYTPLEKSIRSVGSDHIYVKFKFKVDSNPVGGIKFLKIFGVPSPGPSYANWTWNFGPTTKTPSFLTALCYGEGVPLANDTNVCIYPDGTVNGPAGAITLTELSGARFSPTPGQWYEVSTYNRYSTDGAADGEMWMAIDGKRILHVTNVKNRNDANSRVIDAIHFGDYSNPNANMTVWFDDIEISDHPLSTYQPVGGLSVIQKKQ